MKERQNLAFVQGVALYLQSVVPLIVASAWVKLASFVGLEARLGKIK
jgi:hypothetical protein